MSYLSITPSAYGDFLPYLAKHALPSNSWERWLLHQTMLRTGFKERHNHGRQRKPLVGENLLCPSKVLGLCMRMKLFSETRFCSKYCLTDMLNVLEKHRMIIFSIELIKKNVFVVSETRTCRHMSLDSGFEKHLLSIFNRWEHS